MKDVDKLIELVFEGDEGARKAALTSGDDGSKREIETLLNLRADLAKLREVPECQLTTEHLRSAVLKGAAPRKPRAMQLWMAPIAVAAAVAAFFLLRGPVQPNSPYSGPVATTVVPNELPIVEGSKAPETVAESTASKSIVTAPTSDSMVASRSRAERAANRHRTLSDAQEIRNAVRVATEMGITATSTEPAPAGRGGMAQPAEFDESASEMRETKLTASPMVVVSDTRSPETGAANAMEVAIPRDVVFGG